MKTIDDFFTHNPLGESVIKYKLTRANEIFSKWLPETCPEIWVCALSQFVLSSPLNYWNEEKIDQGIKILEKNPEKTEIAIKYREEELNHGINCLFRMHDKGLFEDLIGIDTPSEILRLSNEVHPEYLLFCEQIYGNLLALFWSIMKKKDVKGKCDLPSAVKLLKENQADMLTGGYDDKIRNAIAHGQVNFKGLGIQYGDLNYQYELSTYEFFDKYDEIWRTSVSMVLAILLFLARRTEKRLIFPTSINRILVSAYVDRNAFLLKDYLISELANRGRQLHILFQTNNLSRTALIFDCLHAAIRFYQLGERNYSRVIFGFSYSKKDSSGFLAINYLKLATLIETNAPWERVNEIIDANLLWYDEPRQFLIFRSLLENIRNNFQVGYRNFIHENHKLLNLLPPNTYEVKHTRNASAGGIPRIEITAVLSNHDYCNNHDLLKMVCRSITRKYLNQWIGINPSDLTRRINLFLPPIYVWVRLYRRNGTKRWLANSGWANRELICISEFIKGKHPPIYIKQPDIVEHNIRYKFSAEFPRIDKNS